MLAILALPLMLLALAAAGYSAFLFGQAEGRDFWQSPLVLPHLLASAVAAGAAAALLVTPPSAASRMLLLVGLGLNLLLILAECYTSHATADARSARGPSPGAASAWSSGSASWRPAPLLPALLVIPDSGVTSTLAAALALVGLYLWEDCWVRAGQIVPLS